jgi:hypothetical protein
MRILMLMAALMLATGVEASCALSSARLSSGLVKVGDSDRRVLEARPDRVVRLETEQGGAAGMRYDFHQQGETVQIYVQAGRIVRVCRVRE